MDFHFQLKLQSWQYKRKILHNLKSKIREAILNLLSDDAKIVRHLSLSSTQKSRKSNEESDSRMTEWEQNFWKNYQNAWQSPSSMKRGKICFHSISKKVGGIKSNHLENFIWNFWNSWNARLILSWRCVKVKNSAGDILNDGCGQVCILCWPHWPRKIP